MAKKKKKKSAKKGAKKASGRTATRGSRPCSDEELVDAGFLCQVGRTVLEALIEAGESHGIQVSGIVGTALATHSNSLSEEQDNGQQGFNAARTILENRDTLKKPYLRVVGRVVEVLTIHRKDRRGRDFCSVGDVLRVFLEEIPDHAPYDPADYRLAQQTRRGNDFDLTRDPGKTGIRTRLAELKKWEFLERVSRSRDGSDRGYRLTAVGRNLFDRWPNVEGLDEQGPPAAGQQR